MPPRIYYSIHVRGYESRALAYQIYHDDVYISESGRFSGPNKQKTFESEEEAKQYIANRKDKDRYDLSVVKITSWE